MSRDADETPPLPPRRPKPAPANLAEGQETFRPTPRPAPVGVGSSKKSGREPAPVVGGPNLVERVFFGKVSSGHLATFCGQFGSYQDAGVDLLRSLASLKKQFARSALGPVIGRLEQAVRGGDPLAEAMAREPQAFDNLCIAMIRVAEARGGVPETLRLLARHYEARQRLIRQARSALIYPTIVLIIAAAVVMLLAIFVLPKFAELLSDLTRGKDAALPFPSRVLMGLSKFMTSHGWWTVPLGSAAAVFGSMWWYRTPSGKAVLDGLSLYVPVLGKLRRKIETGRFARTLAALLQAGVDIGASLDLTAGVLNLASFRRAITGVRTLVMDGDELSQALQATGRFGPEVIAIVESGEESGRLPESLDKLANDQEEQVEYIVKNLGNLVQPALMIVMGGVVLFIILAVILPYIQAITSLTN